MNLDKFLWSKTKVDILKYLLFRRQWVSMRALESELSRTFPSIKKQIDSLEESDVVLVNKQNMKWSIAIKPEIINVIKWIFMYSLIAELEKLFFTHSFLIEKYFFGKFFWRELEIDLVIIHQTTEKTFWDKLKDEISQIFKNYFIDNISMTLMSSTEREKRQRLADKFVLNILRSQSQK